MKLARRVRLTALTVTMLVAMPLTPASAQEVADSHLAAARTAIDAINATDDFDNVLPQAAQSLKGELIQHSPNLADLVSATVDRQAIELAQRRADLENEAALVYARIFTEEELSDIAEFYNSPSGQKLLAEGPIVTREVMQAAEIWRRGIIRDLSNGVTEQLEDALGAQAPEVSVPDGG